jgi:uncharacterized protein YkwD
MKKKNTKKILYPFSSAVIAAGILLTNTAEPSSYINIGYAEELTGIIDPFKQKDTAFLNRMESEGMAKLNAIRASLGLPTISINPNLTKAAQSHSNYLVKYHLISHIQTNKNDSEYFTGAYADDRAAYYGYNKKVGEGISFQTRNTVTGIEKLIAAPYHRVTLLDPNYNEGGIGFNDTTDDFNPTVINLADNNNDFTESGPVLYPTDNQQNVPTEWFANESPNPLRFWGLDDVYVGYPITISMYGANKGKLVAKSVSLKNEKGEDVPFYLVDGNKDGTLSSIFIIPKQPLAQGTKYTVDVEADSYSKYSEITPIHKTWSFQTIGGYELKDVIILSNSNNTKVFKVLLENGDVSGMKWEVRDQNGSLVQTYNEKGTNGYLGYKSIVDGTYKLTVSFKDSSQVIVKNLEVKGDEVFLEDAAQTPSQPVETPTTPPPAPVEEKPTETERVPNETSGTKLEDYVLVEEYEISEGASGIRIPFSVAIDPSTITDKSVFLLDEEGNKQPITFTLVDGGKKLEIRFNGMNLKAGDKYTLYVDKTIKGVQGNQLPQASKFTLIVKGDTNNNPFEEPKQDESTVPSNEPSTGTTEEQPNQQEEKPTRDLSRFILVKEYEITTAAKGFRIPFSVAIDKNTITNESVFLLDSNGKDVKAQIELSKDGKALEVRFDSDVHLEEGQQYTLYIDNTIKGIKGNKLTNPSKFIIKVIKEQEKETDTPKNDLPKDLEKYQEKFKPITGVAPTQTLSVRFTGKIDPSTVNKESVFILDKNNQKVDIDIELASDNKTLLIKPTNGYMSGETYTLFIDNTIKSITGIPIKEAIKVTFTTR